MSIYKIHFKLSCLLIMPLLFSCSSTIKEVNYELIKVDHGELLDVVFRITNNTDKLVTLDEPREGTCATLVREWKYVKNENSKWESILQIVGTAQAPPVFEIAAGQSKEFIIISAWNKKKLAAVIKKEEIQKILFRVWYTSTNEEGIYTNSIELNE